MLKILKRKPQPDRSKITRFEQAYIDLYSDRITAEDFADAAGIPDRAQAWKQLCEYRERVLSGQIPDPRDKYDCWR